MSQALRTVPLILLASVSYQTQFATASDKPNAIIVMTDVWFREGMRFIEENRSNPFLLYLATNAPHGPYRVPPEWAKPYIGNRDAPNPNLYGMIADIDHNMRLLRKHLTKPGLALKWPTRNTERRFRSWSAPGVNSKSTAVPEGIDEMEVWTYLHGIDKRSGEVLWRENVGTVVHNTPTVGMTADGKLAVSWGNGNPKNLPYTPDKEL